MKRVLDFAIYGAAAYGIGAGLAHLFSGAYGGRYGSNFHRLVHKYGNWTGRIGHVRCVDIANKRHVKVFGLVCSQCGFVDVNRVMGDDELVQDEIFDRDTGSFCWTILDWTPKRAEGASKVKV